MPIFLVEHTETLEFTVEAKDREELDDALADMSDYEWRDFAGQEESNTVCLAHKSVKIADCGVVDGAIVVWEDYQDDLAKREESKQEPPDVLTLSLPGVE